MKNFVIIFALLLHLGCLLLSCGGKKDGLSEIEDGSRAQFIMANVFQDKTGDYHLTWETTSRNAKVNIFVADSGLPLDYDQDKPLQATIEKTAIINQPTGRFLHLVIFQQDTLVLEAKTKKN